MAFRVRKLFGTFENQPKGFKKRQDIYSIYNSFNTTWKTFLVTLGIILLPKRNICLVICKTVVLALNERYINC